MVHVAIQRKNANDFRVAGLILLQRRFRSTLDDLPRILTLDRAKLQTKGQSVYDISNKKVHFVRFRNTSGLCSAQFRFQATKDEDGMTQSVPFPPNTRGVFYYHQDLQLPSLSGAVRFRVCDSLHSFDQGQDLFLTIGKPWSVPLIRIVHNNTFRDLGQFLIGDGLVQKSLLRDLSRLEAPSKIMGLYLYQLSQPFVINLDATAFLLHLVTRKTISSTIFSSPLYNSHKAHKPYSGIARVQFELSRFREHKEKGPTLVLRLLEFLTPVQRILPLDTGPYVELIPNALAMRRTASGRLKPWGYPIYDRSEGAKWREFFAAIANN